MGKIKISSTDNFLSWNVAPVC